MDYSQLSDVGINRRVAAAVGVAPESVYQVNSKNAYDPCNNPADAWPIIESNYIALHPLKHKSVWIAVSDDQEHTFRDAKPMRAAMVIFLMSKESLNA